MVIVGEIGHTCNTIGACIGKSGAGVCELLNTGVDKVCHIQLTERIHGNVGGIIELGVGSAPCPANGGDGVSGVVEYSHTVIPGIGNIDVICINCHAGGIIELRGTRAGHASGPERGNIGGSGGSCDVEDLHAVVAGIRNVELRAIDRDVPGAVEVIVGRTDNAGLADRSPGTTPVLSKI